MSGLKKLKEVMVPELPVQYWKQPSMLLWQCSWVTWKVQALLKVTEVSRKTLSSAVSPSWRSSWRCWPGLYPQRVGTAG